MDDSQLEVINKDKGYKPTFAVMDKGGHKSILEDDDLVQDDLYQFLQLEVINEEEEFKPLFALFKGQHCHERFFFLDGDLVLMTPSVNFRVHIHRLQSTVLDSVFKPLKGHLGKSTKHVIYMQTPRDSDSDWASFLGEIYNDNR